VRAPPRARRISEIILAAATALAGPSAAGAARDEPFEIATARVPGRVLQVIAAEPGEGCPATARGWLAVSVRGTPPDEERLISIFDCSNGGPFQPEATRSLPVSPQVVAFDVADVDAAPGDELVLLTADALHIASPWAPERKRVVRLPVTVPLPPRTRELSRIHLVDTWNGDGRRLALVPAGSGGLLIGFDGQPARSLQLPILAHYRTPDTAPPAHDHLLSAEIRWPTLDLADDDGDGRPDLFALSRYAVWIFHTGPDGVPEFPSRQLVLRPFTEDEELRHDTTGTRTLARDVDGDGLGDLLVDSGAGTIIGSHHMTEIYRNRGSGVSLEGGPDMTLAMDTGMASIRLVDLDGDGRLDFLQTSLRFGIAQVWRMLTSQSTKITLATYTPNEAANALEATWKSGITLKLDLASGRIADLLPAAQGDWNGDGHRDLLYGVGSKRLAIRLGKREEAGPGFGSVAATQDLPGMTHSTIADLDGDGLDDLMLWDPRDRDGTVHLLRNRGILPGTSPTLQAADR
jgi:hypothetical protein